MSTKVGVLALQGAFIEHAAKLEELGTEVIEVRLPRDLKGLDGLIIPGGESTTIGKLMVAYDLQNPIRGLAQEGMPAYGTCAGMILLAKKLDGSLDQPLLGIMDIVVRRNAFGRQLDSFEADVNISELGDAPFHTVFIRAPIICSVGDGVEVLGSLPDGRIIAARERNLLASSFHPELTKDNRFHAYFLKLVSNQSTVRA